MDLDFDKYKAQQFCDNEACTLFGEVGAGNIRIQSRKNKQVYIQTIHHGKRTSEEAHSLI